MEKPYVKTVEVHMCSACGEDHNALMAVKMDKPKVIDDLSFTHVAICPVKNTPVYILFS